ncbi:hypothetical protein SprV_0501840500 [Sparganum proliferum]
MVRHLQDGMVTHVTDCGAVSEAFVVTNGVKQGCVLAPTLFSFMFSVMQLDERPGIRIANRMDSQLLNHRQTHFQSRSSTATVHKLTVDCALNITTDEEMQLIMDFFDFGCAHFRLTINTDKMVVVMHQQPPNAEYSVPCIHVDGTEPKIVDNLNYLGSRMSRRIRNDDKVVYWISKVSQAFGRLQNAV